MDVDGDDVASTWQFDSFSSPSQSPVNLQFASTPSQSLLNLPFASPPSPLWDFDERAMPLDASSSDLEFSRFLAGGFDFGMFLRLLIFPLIIMSLVKSANITIQVNSISDILVAIRITLASDAFISILNWESYLLVIFYL